MRSIIDLTTPLYVIDRASGPVLDLREWVPTSLRSQHTDNRGYALSFLPSLLPPTGSWLAYDAVAPEA